MDPLIFKSQTYGSLDITEIPDKIQKFYDKTKHFESDFRIIVGTDSQNFSYTKMVSVIAIVCEGHGGIFFHRITHQPIIKDVRSKLHIETNESLELASKIIELLEDKKYEDMFMHCTFTIHVDAGHSERGKTKDLIPELVGWIKSCGYDCEVKPDSFVASSIADKISK
jgi:hypothetical protein